MTILGIKWSALIFSRGKVWACLTQPLTEELVSWQK